MRSDMLDILFENRNKTYGAYVLRRTYAQRLYTSIGVTFGVALLSVLLMQIPAVRKTGNVLITTPIIDITPISAEPNVTEQPKAPAKPASQPPPAQIDFATVVIVPDLLVKPIATQDDLDNAAIGLSDEPGDVTAGDAPVVSGDGNTNGNLPVAASEPVKVVEPIILERSDVMPQFPGGDKAFQKFMHQNLRQPDDIAAGQQIRVLVRFVVDKNGVITEAQIIGAGRKDLDKEVMRVVGKMPDWIPGKQKGEPVAVYFNLPVTFVAQEE